MGESASGYAAPETASRKWAGSRNVVRSLRERSGQPGAGTKAGGPFPADKLDRMTATRDTTGCPIGGMKSVSGYAFDPKTDPAKLGLVLKEAPFGANTKVTYGLPRLDGDTVPLANGLGPAGHPEKPGSTKENGLRVFTFERADE